MNKKNLHILIIILSVVVVAVLAVVIIFGTSITSNQCRMETSEEKEGVEEESEDKEESGEEGAEEETAEAGEGEADEDREEPEEESEKEKNKEETGEEQETKAPTIELEIYQDATLSGSICYYRVQANVTGTPAPTIEWSKDDSHGAWGDKKAQVNLNDPAEIYTLTATATNSEGNAEDSIGLSWGCPIPNNPPEISEITVMGTKYTNRTYGLSVSASDPDGDTLTYNWTVTGGTIDDSHAQNINWTTPSACGDYKITVTVSDGKGGEASKSEDIYVHFFYDMLNEAPGADWYNATGDNHLWDVGLNDPRGFACYRTNIKLENNNTYTKVLETHPRWDSFGFIGGEYGDIIEIPEGARFKAEVGFISGATGTDGAGFIVVFRDTSYVVHYITSVSGYHAEYDGALDSLNLDLSSFAGQSGELIIGVKAGASSAQDWAVWVNPQITN